MITSKTTKAQMYIRSYLDRLDRKVFMKKHLKLILEENSKAWGIPIMSDDKFISFLVNMKLREIEISSPHYSESFIRYIWGKRVPVYQLGLTLRSNAYLSHHTAMYIHKLTKHKSEMVYVNSEQSQKYIGGSSLRQESIDRAFKGKVRTSNYIIPVNDKKICLLSGKNTKNLGIERIEVLREGFLDITNIERTLIDIAVRPIYSGGCKEVLSAYKKAKGKISGTKLFEMLQQINFIYPYHQAIGFYMQRAEFDDFSYNQFKKIGLKYDFYLDYKMKRPNYSKEWRLYYPEDL